jgi:hypothetical protein
MQYGKAARKEEGEQPKPQIKDTRAPVEVEPASKQGALPTETAQLELRVQEAKQEAMRSKQVAETTARQAELLIQAEQEATRHAQEAEIVAEEKALLAQRTCRISKETEQGALLIKDTTASEGQQLKRQKKVPAPKGERDDQRIPINTEAVGASPKEASLTETCPSCLKPISSAGVHTCYACSKHMHGWRNCGAHAPGQNSMKRICLPCAKKAQSTPGRNRDPATSKRKNTEGKHKDTGSKRKDTEDKRKDLATSKRKNTEDKHKDTGSKRKNTEDKRKDAGDQRKRKR